MEGAEPGDVLRVDILTVELRSNWAWTAARPYGGILGINWPAPCHLRHTRLDRTMGGGDGGRAGGGTGGGGSGGGGGGGTAFPSWGGQLPCAPFFGVMGVAPPAAVGRVSSIPPKDEFGGNIDLKELVAGTTLWLPVNVAGALLFVGDGHARQGDGECCGTALETALTGKVQEGKWQFVRSG